MSKSISVAQLGKTINKYLEEYGDEALEVVEEATNKYTAEALKEVKQSSPRHTGDYKKGWKKQVEKERLSSTGVVYNATNYQLIHLLEFGHNKRNGGRTRAIPHVEPVNDSIIEKFEKEIESKL